MSPQDISLVRESFRRVAPIADQAAAIFYARLFELDPTLRELFDGNMADQGRKLMRTIGTAVSTLDKLEALAPSVRELGMRHAGYRVREEHYYNFGEALLWTLARTLGPEFTTEMQTAWGKLYWLLAETMKAGMRDGLNQRARSVA